MERLRKIGRNLGSAAGIVLALLLVLGVSTRALAATDPGCTALGGDDTTVPGECQVSGTVTASGVINLGETLHMLGTGKIIVPAAPASLTINITLASGDFVMESGSLINGDVGGCPKNGPNITVALTGGDIDLKTGAIIRSNGCSGGFIQITTVAPGNGNIDGTVESVGVVTGPGAKQPPGGGPITIKACNLTVSDTGLVSSRGFDPGADLVHLEGCVVTINGRVESTGPGHAPPNLPPNSCDTVTPAQNSPPRRNPVTRPGKPANSTGCVEIWSGTTVLIDSTGTATGEVNADIGTTGGSGGRGWIDILANSNIEIRDGAGNDHTGTCSTTFAVHANSCSGSDLTPGLIMIQSYAGDVIASGDAIQADATNAGSTGGEIIVEAQRNINFTPALGGANLFARGGLTGGKIGPSIPTDLSHLPAGAAPIRAFTGFLNWTSGTGDVSPAGGEVNLKACAGVTLGATFLPSAPVVAPAACGGAPTPPVYATPFPLANCRDLCEGAPGGSKEGVKFNDLNKDGKRDPLEPLLDGWEIHLTGILTSGLPFAEVIVTTGQSPFLPGSYVFTGLPNGTYTVCEILKPTWTQTAPITVPPPAGETLADCTGHTHGGTLTPGPRGYTFMVTDTAQTFAGNDFGNFQQPVICPKFPGLTADVTITIDPNNPTQIQDAINALPQDKKLLIMPHLGTKTENITIDKRIQVIGCSITLTAATVSAPVVTIGAGAANGSTTDVHATGSTEAGYKIEGQSHTVKNVRSFGNAIGFWITGDGNTVTGALGTTGNNIGFKIDGDGNVVDTASGVTGSNSHGAHITSGASGNTIKKSTFTGNGGEGIFVEGTGNVISENKLYSNVLNGINVPGASTQVLKNIAGDKNKGNGLDGILVSGNSGPLTENTARSNGKNGIEVTGTAHTLTKNTAGGDAQQANTLCEFVIGASNLNGGSNKANNQSFSFGAGGVACVNP